MSSDPNTLSRFTEAQQPVYEIALAELRAGAKRTHWMWFVFPQLRGLGVSDMAAFYGIASLDEARAYRTHPILGPRLVAATSAVLGVEGRDLHAIFGSPDDIKFRSSMTLFERASGADAGLFAEALERLCGGRRDERTLDLLDRA